MGGLAHYIEDEGVATTGISLVRVNTEELRPPRFLWVPFELGRPFGAPNDPAFQTRVLSTALNLLEREDGPAILDDFPDEPPGGGPTDMTGWTCPISFPAPASTDAPTLLTKILGEISTLAPWHDVAREARGRTSVGAAKMDIRESVRFLHALLEGGGVAEPPPTALEPGPALRGASEDLKTFYMEAATAQPGQASSRDLADWFWGATAAGKLLLALHPICVASSDAGVSRIASAQLIPRAQAHRLDG